MVLVSASWSFASSDLCASVWLSLGRVLTSCDPTEEADEVVEMSPGFVNTRGIFFFFSLPSPFQCFVSDALSSRLLL